jgi:hypothetical protein
MLKTTSHYQTALREIEWRDCGVVCVAGGKKIAQIAD